MTLHAILEAVTDLHLERRAIKLIVITGGEPFRQDLGELLRTLMNCGYTIQVETNGSLAPPSIPYELYGIRDIKLDGRLYVVCSPKAGKVNPELERVACCYKYVMTARSMDVQDGLPNTALDHTAHPRLARPGSNFSRPIYLQPADEKDPKKNAYNLKACVESCMDHGYTLQLQTHKILGVP
jgi:7-carboxy-7-deazaguanine synthase